MGFVDDSVVVHADVQDVYSLWLDYEGYPRFMSGMDEVAVVGYCRLRWTGRVCGAVLEWETDVVAHVEDTRVRWQATDGRETGEVDLREAGRRRHARPLPARVRARRLGRRRGGVCAAACTPASATTCGRSRPSRRALPSLTAGRRAGFAAAGVDERPT